MGDSVTGKAEKGQNKIGISEFEGGFTGKDERREKNAAVHGKGRVEKNKHEGGGKGKKNQGADGETFKEGGRNVGKGNETGRDEKKILYNVGGAGNKDRERKDVWEVLGKN